MSIATNAEFLGRSGANHSRFFIAPGPIREPSSMSSHPGMSLGSVPSLMSKPAESDACHNA